AANGPSGGDIGTARATIGCADIGRVVRAFRDGPAFAPTHVERHRSMSSGILMAIAMSHAPKGWMRAIGGELDLGPLAVEGDAGCMGTGRQRMTRVARLGRTVVSRARDLCRVERHRHQRRSSARSIFARVKTLSSERMGNER